MRASRIIIIAALLGGLYGFGPAAAADLDELGGRPPQGAAVDAYGYRYAHGYRALPPGGPYVVAPRAYTLLAPRRGPPPLRYAPPPVYPVPPPLIAAVPIIGPYLVPPPYGPPPATVLDAYDHRYDYNQ